jgi:hypothetical protein
MSGVGMLSGNTRYCPKDGVSVAHSACYDCPYFRKWHKDPNRVATCWWDYELEKELKYVDFDFRK